MHGTRREILVGAASASIALGFAMPGSAKIMKVSVGNLKVHLWRHSKGNSHALPVIYVHGATFPSSLAIGWKFAERRSWADDITDAGYDVWGFDFVGYGLSDRYPAMAQAPRPGPLGRSDDAIRQLAGVVRRVRAETGKSSVALLAHSWGTIVAARFAAEFPSEIDRLVLFGPILRREGGDSSGIDRLPGWGPVTMDSQLSRFREDVPAGEPELLTDAMFAPWGTAYLATDRVAMNRVPPAVAVPNGPIADILAARAGNLPYDPARIACPVSIVRGAWDSRVTDADVAAFKTSLSDCPSFADAKLEKGTHLMHLETGRTRLWTATRNALAEGKQAALDTHAVMFEVRPSEDGRKDYLATAAALRPLLDEIDGFISIERFQSVARPGWILSLSCWADEAAISAWRSRERHYAAQSHGRAGIFDDYRLRVAHVLSDSGVAPGRQPLHASTYNDSSRRPIRYVGLMETVGDLSRSLASQMNSHSGLKKAEAFLSLTDPEKAVHLLEFPDSKSARAWASKLASADVRQVAGTKPVRVRLLEVLRDYGMFDRTEAPQYHPPTNIKQATA